jgi:hypothetical protein
MTDFLDEQNASYDKLAKSFLSRKAILAQILKYAVKEFADCSLKDIEEKYIEGDPSLAVNAVPLDDTLDIKGKHTESNSLKSGLVTFDIIFDAIAPDDGKPVKIIINIEPQKTTRKIHYKLMKRAVYYAARLISDQKEKEFHGDHYNGIKKIYSIWICIETQNYRANSIQEYHLTEQLIHGDFRDDPKNYDLISIVILNLGQNQTSHRLLNLLYLAFVDIKSSDEKETILRDEYDIELTRDMKEELKKMGGLMEPAVKFAAKRAAKEAAKKAKAEATAETKKQTLLENIRSLMESTQWTAQKAMDALKIPVDKQKEYSALI